MKDYIVKNVQECLDSFEDIIKNAKHGFLRCAYEKPEYYNGRGIVISVIDERTKEINLALNIFIGVLGVVRLILDYTHWYY